MPFTMIHTLKNVKGFGITTYFPYLCAVRILKRNKTTC